MAPLEPAGYLDEMIALIAELRAAVHEAHQLAESGHRRAALSRSTAASLIARRLHRHLVSVAVPVVEHTQDLLRQARWAARRDENREFGDVAVMLGRIDALVDRGGS